MEVCLRETEFRKYFLSDDKLEGYEKSYLTQIKKSWGDKWFYPNMLFNVHRPERAMEQLKNKGYLEHRKDPDIGIDQYRLIK